MDILLELRKILTELLDVEEEQITPETFLIQDLGVESIDLLELAVAINGRFNIMVRDEEIFLTRFRLHLMEGKEEGRDAVSYLSEKYPFLPGERIHEMIENIEKGPQLKVKDVVSYIAFHIQER